MHVGFAQTQGILYLPPIPFSALKPLAEIFLVPHQVLLAGLVFAVALLQKHESGWESPSVCPSVLQPKSLVVGQMKTKGARVVLELFELARL